MAGWGPFGLRTAVGFASQGHRVIGFDIDENRRAEGTQGKPPFYEKGLEAGVKRGPRQKRLSGGDPKGGAGPGTGVIFLLGGAPSKAGGGMGRRPPHDAAQSR